MVESALADSKLLSGRNRNTQMERFQHVLQAPRVNLQVREAGHHQGCLRRTTDSGHVSHVESHCKRPGQRLNAKQRYQKTS